MMRTTATRPLKGATPQTTNSKVPQRGIFNEMIQANARNNGPAAC
jgi:hypothetical protein